MAEIMTNFRAVDMLGVAKKAKPAAKAKAPKVQAPVVVEPVAVEEPVAVVEAPVVEESAPAAE